MRLAVNYHCVKSIRVRSYSGTYFAAFRLNSDENNSEYGHFLRGVFLRKTIHHRCFTKFEIPLCKWSSIKFFHGKAWMKIIPASLFDCLYSKAINLQHQLQGLRFFTARVLFYYENDLSTPTITKATPLSPELMNIFCLWKIWVTFCEVFQFLANVWKGFPPSEITRHLNCIININNSYAIRVALVNKEIVMLLGRKNFA